MRDLYETFPLSSSRLSMAPTWADYVEDIVLPADTLLRVALPAGAQFVLFAMDGDFRAKPGTGSTSFALPGATTSDGSGSELNPAARRIPGTLSDGTTVPTHLILRAPYACKGSLAFYA
ncbi:hypothetical protein [Bosea sp. ASV33]|uniref:hypothetical protein n=1 Tax=Bosea sp. ASV33 TaxID=2795106 RepID=UPI0018ED50F5|nr:hypothetical protein [Bosea sp. ASV33]